VGSKMKQVKMGQYAKKSQHQAPKKAKLDSNVQIPKAELKVLQKKGPFIAKTNS
jgi:hypothetical protein